MNVSLIIQTDKCLFEGNQQDKKKKRRSVTETPTHSNKLKLHTLFGSYFVAVIVVVVVVVVICLSLVVCLYFAHFGETFLSFNLFIGIFSTWTQMNAAVLRKLHIAFFYIRCFSFVSVIMLYLHRSDACIYIHTACNIIWIFAPHTHTHACAQQILWDRCFLLVTYEERMRICPRVKCWNARKYI